MTASTSPTLSWIRNFSFHRGKSLWFRHFDPPKVHLALCTTTSTCIYNYSYNTMQSLRQPLRSLPSLVSSSRHFASSSRISFPDQTPAPDASAAESSDSGFGGFGALTTALAPEARNPYSSANTSIYSSPSAHTPERAEAIRGYTEAIPPQIDPLLDIFTNMLMKHGRKAEAQSNVSHILSML